MAFKHSEENDGIIDVTVYRGNDKTISLPSHDKKPRRL